MKTVLLVLVVSASACRREPEAEKAAPSVASARPSAPPPAPRDGGAVAPAPAVRMPIAAAKLELVGNATIKALELADSGEVRAGDKVLGTLSPDGRFTRDGQVIAELAEDGHVRFPGMSAPPLVRIDPEGEVFVDGELAMTIGDDGKISTVDADGVITENVMALLEAPPQGRRAVAMLLVLVTAAAPAPPPPPPTTHGTAPEPAP